MKQTFERRAGTRARKFDLSHDCRLPQEASQRGCRHPSLLKPALQKLGSLAHLEASEWAAEKDDT